MKNIFMIPVGMSSDYLRQQAQEKASYSTTSRDPGVTSDKTHPGIASNKLNNHYFTIDFDIVNWRLFVPRSYQTRVVK